MAIDFPASPVVSQQYVYGGVTYTYTAQGIWASGAAGEFGWVVPPGTVMLFQQSAAPVGWTKRTTHDDKSLRVVSGSVGNGGSVAFSTVFGRTAVDSHTLTIAQLAAHSHNIITAGQYFTYTIGGGLYGVQVDNGTKSSYLPDGYVAIQAAVSNTGSGSGHAHGLDLRVAYVDIILAAKD